MIKVFTAFAPDQWKTKTTLWKGETYKLSNNIHHHMRQNERKEKTKHTSGENEIINTFNIYVMALANLEIISFSTTCGHNSYLLTKFLYQLLFQLYILFYSQD